MVCPTRISFLTVKIWYRGLITRAAVGLFSVSRHFNSPDFSGPRTLHALQFNHTLLKETYVGWNILVYAIAYMKANASLTYTPLCFSTLARFLGLSNCMFNVVTVISRYHRPLCPTKSLVIVLSRLFGISYIYILGRLRVRVTQMCV